MPMDRNYIMQRLSEINGTKEAVGTDPSLQGENERLRAEVLTLKEQLNRQPHAILKSDAQAAFEQSPEFEQLLNVYFMRWVRERFVSEFRESKHMSEFQKIANQAFADFEKNSKKEGVRNGQNSKAPAKGNGIADAGKDA